MQMDILTVGKIKERYLTEAAAEYLKRLSAYAKISIREVQDEKTPEYASAVQQMQIIEKEATRLEALIKPQTYLIALAIAGRAFTSEDFARHLEQLATGGRSHITFLVGGSLGLSQQLISKADLVLSFSSLTFPHQLFRVMLLEQLYRAFKIIRNEPYHK